MRRWKFAGREGLTIVIESDDDVLDDDVARRKLSDALATAEDGRGAAAVVMQRFDQTHEVDRSAADRALAKPAAVTFRMRRRPSRIWT